MPRLVVKLAPAPRLVCVELNPGPSRVCVTCSRSFPSAKMLAIHVSKHHGQSSSSAAEQIQSTPATPASMDLIAASIERLRVSEGSKDSSPSAEGAAATSTGAGRGAGRLVFDRTIPHPDDIPGQSVSLVLGRWLERCLRTPPISIDVPRSLPDYSHIHNSCHLWLHKLFKIHKKICQQIMQPYVIPRDQFSVLALEEVLKKGTVIRPPKDGLHAVVHFRQIIWPMNSGSDPDSVRQKISLAIKVYRRTFLDPDDGRERRASVDDILREISLLAIVKQLSIPYCVPLFGVAWSSTSPDWPAIITPMVHGSTLGTILPRQTRADQERMQPELKKLLLLHLCEHLTMLHAVGIYHRDLHFDNMILGRLYQHDPASLWIVDFSAAGSFKVESRTAQETQQCNDAVRADYRRFCMLIDELSPPSVEEPFILGVRQLTTTAPGDAPGSGPASDIFLQISNIFHKNSTLVHFAGPSAVEVDTNTVLVNNRKFLCTTYCTNHVQVLAFGPVDVPVHWQYYRHFPGISSGRFGLVQLGLLEPRYDSGLTTDQMSSLALQLHQVANRSPPMLRLQRDNTTTPSRVFRHVERVRVQKWFSTIESTVHEWFQRLPEDIAKASPLQQVDYSLYELMLWHTGLRAGYDSWLQQWGAGVPEMALSGTTMPSALLCCAIRCGRPVSRGSWCIRCFRDYCDSHIMTTNHECHAATARSIQLSSEEQADSTSEVAASAL